MVVSRAALVACLGKIAVVAQRDSMRPLYFVTIRDADVIAFEAFFNSASILSRSANVRRTSSARAAFLSKKSRPCTRMRSNNGFSTSRSRGSHWRVVLSTQMPSLRSQRFSLSTCRSCCSSLVTKMATGIERSFDRNRYHETGAGCYWTTPLCCVRNRKLHEIVRTDEPEHDPHRKWEP